MIADEADALYCTFDDITWLEELRRRTRESDASRSSRSDEIPRKQSHSQRELGNDLGNIKYQIARAVVLSDFAIDPAGYTEVVRIFDLVGGDDPGAHRSVAIQAFAFEELVMTAL